MHDETIAETAPENPQAFPTPKIKRDGWGNEFTEPGMSLRDWFAGQAIPAVIEKCGGDRGRAKYSTFEEYFAVTAYEIADAMLRERSK